MSSLPHLPYSTVPSKPPLSARPTDKDPMPLLPNTVSRGVIHRPTLKVQILVVLGALTMAAAFGTALWLIVTPQIKPSNYFNTSGVYTMNNYNAVVSFIGAVIMTAYGYILTKGASAIMMQRLCAKGITIRHAQVLTKVAVRECPVEWYGVWTHVIFISFLISVAFSAGFQASMGASSSEIEYVRVGPSASPNDVEAFVNSTFGLLPRVASLADDMAAYVAAKDSDSTAVVYSISGDPMLGNSTSGFSSFSYAGSFAGVGSPIGNLSEPTHIRQLRKAAGNGIILRGSGFGSWAYVTCQQVPMSVTFRAIGPFFDMARVTGGCDELAIPLYNFTTNIWIPFSCDTQSLFVANLSPQNRDATQDLFQCQADIRYQPQNFTYNLGIGGKALQVGTMQPVEQSVQQALLSATNAAFFSNVGPGGHQALRQAMLFAQTAGKDSATALGHALSLLYGAFTASVTDMATMSFNSGDFPFDSSKVANSSFTMVIPVVIFGNDEFKFAWLIGLLLPLLVSGAILVVNYTVAPLYKSDFTDPTAVLISAVSDQPDPDPNSDGSRSFRGCCLGEMAKGTPTNLRIYFKAPISDPNHAQFSLIPPNEDEILVRGARYS
ncbi:hypothetical protein OIV83_000406 [Microbotryomycetes sp. JL201]|nr:hypothetical protein OIV83_000406 [Microbotryomycetes sp. JL201]